MTEDEIKLIINKYIYNHDLTDFEIVQLEKYLAHSENKLLFEKIMEKESKDSFDEKETIDPEISAEIYKKLKKEIKEVEVLPSKKRTAFAPQLYFRIAAVFTFLLLISTITIFYYFSNSKNIYISTSVGERKTIVLPDNSTITLNNNSSIKYTDNWFESDLREIELEGEAFFDVVKDPNKPFIVYTSQLNIKVLGTSFNVKSYKEDDNITTTLIKGSVAIQQKNEEATESDDVVLKENQKAIFHKGSQNLVLQGAKDEKETSWKQGKLVFEDNSFIEIFRELERWYGIKIKYKVKSANSCRFNLKIENESLVQVLDLFKSTTDLNYTINGNNVKIEGNLCEN